ncbi:MAG TPA: crotonase/enoyl-CoA hydratase family protein [Candidatus Deferrimicrobiaceae bacterium]|jgi:DSF synthase|nr:crotonase/enoyl-CoA hydratase family protein [Candidatus Deferrimicrobiaceae bacterium]
MPANVAYLDPFLYPFQQMHTRFEAEYGIMWYHMDPKPRPCFNPELLKELKKFVDSLAHIHKRAPEQEQNGALRYTVFASRHPGVFSLGGDLELLLGLVKARDGEGLRRYAKACIDVVYSGMVNHEVPVTTISLVQGDAMGGGFEAAMCNNVIIAEKSASFGFPEVLFNLFPGMGAHKLLARRLDPGRAEKIILSGRMYGAAELHEMGLVDAIADDGEGENAVYKFVREHSRRRNTFQSVLRVRRRIHPVSYEELIEISHIWVDAAMQLGERDIRLMERLLKAQDKMVGMLVAQGGVGQAKF